MGIVYSMYDALVSINVPDEKAKAVIDALEREMMDKLATKADLANLQAITKADIANLQAVTKADIANLHALMKAETTNLQAAIKTESIHIREVISRDLQAVNARIDTQLTQLTMRFVLAAGAAASAVAIVIRLF